MAPLPKQRHAAMLVERHYRAGARMAHDRQLNRHAIGQFRLLDADVDHAEFQHFASLYRHALALRASPVLGKRLYLAQGKTARKLSAAEKRIARERLRGNI